MTVIDVMRSSEFFGSWFQDPSWDAWMTFLKVLSALELNENDRAVYRYHTGRATLPSAAIREVWAIVGRRGGKSLISSAIAVYLACFVDHSQYLKPGEVGTIAILAADRRQARTILRYCRALLAVDALHGTVVNDNQESIELRNNIQIEVHTASFRTTRGYTLIAAIIDEIAFFRSDESANPDREVVAAIRPGLATTNGLLLCISSPYSRRGALWEAYSRHFGKDSRVMVWKGTTAEMNSSIDPDVIAQALEDDESAARAEYFAEFRTDTETFVRREIVELCTVRGRTELERAGKIPYYAFVDPSGGSADSMTCAIAHRAADKCVLDLVREVKPPFSPDNVVKEFSETLKKFGISKIVGDKYAGLWPVERFRSHGILYEQSAAPKSSIYLDTLPLLNSNRVELLDHPRLISQLLNLERRTSSSGRDTVDHPLNSHDDLINSGAGALLLASSNPTGNCWGGIF